MDSDNDELDSMFGCRQHGAVFLVAFAQQAQLPAGTSASVATAPLEYRSAFDGYRAYQDPTARSWREVNEEAASLGGTQGIIKPAVVDVDRTAAHARPDCDWRGRRCSSGARTGVGSSHETRERCDMRATANERHLVLT